MLFGNNRDQLRQMYRDALVKSEDGVPMTALETQIADVITQHPEYRAAVAPTASHEEKLDKDYIPETGETNPFMHMSLHLAVRDQLSTNRPAGIREAFADLCTLTQERHQAEHVLCEAMGEELWQSQRNRQPPDEQRYLKRVQAFIGRKKP